MSGRLEFDFEWRITLFTLVLLPLLISLGFWQLHRAGEKTLLAAAFERRQTQAPQPLEEVGTGPAQQLAYLPVELRGRYLPQQTFLLENRVQDGKYGNEVLTVFALDSGALALVDRGWVPADPARQRPTEVPEPPSADTGSTLTGTLYVAPGKPFLLADTALDHGWPKRIQAIEMDKIAVGIGASPYPFPVRIDAGQPGALQVNWEVINITPAKHRAYAVQWFSMAAALFLVYLLRSTNLWQLIRRTPGENESPHE